MKKKSETPEGSVGIPSAIAQTQSCAKGRSTRDCSLK